MKKIKRYKKLVKQEVKIIKENEKASRKINYHHLMLKKLENEKFKLEREFDEKISKERFKIVQQTEKLEKNMKSQKELRNEKNKIISN